MDDAVVVVSDLGKRYSRSDTFAFHDINIEIPKGTVLSLLGGNGSGKSSLLEVISGIRRPTIGSVRVFGKDPRGIRGSIGYLPQNFSLFNELTVRENIRYFSVMNGNDEDIDAVIEEYGVKEFSEKRFDSLSGGMKRRTEIACILASDPDLVLLDEPTAGLDIDSCKELWELIGRLKASGKTVIVASHDMHDAIEHSDMSLYLRYGEQIDDFQEGKG